MGTKTGTGLRVRTVPPRVPRGRPERGRGRRGVQPARARRLRVGGGVRTPRARDDDSEGGHPGVVFRDRTVQAHFADPHLPDALRARVRARPALLRLCETGLPPWAIFLAGYGFFYRPYLRAVARYLFLLVSSLSMLAGFYDLYKHIPGADVVLAGMWSPFTQFLENHARAVVHPGVVLVHAIRDFRAAGDLRRRHRARGPGPARRARADALRRARRGANRRERVEVRSQAVARVGRDDVYR